MIFLMKCQSKYLIKIAKQKMSTSRWPRLSESDHTYLTLVRSIFSLYLVCKQTDMLSNYASTTNKT